MGSDSWVILSPIEISIKRKIESVGVPLKDWDIKIYRGVLTGYNDAFIISTETREGILNNCASEEERKRTEELIRPILRGRDIKRYGYEWANLWLINTHNGIKGKLDRIHIEDYPAVKAHLDQYWDKISTRADKGDTPYNLRNCAYLDDFSKPKIVYREISIEMEACLAPANWMLNNKLYMITSDTENLEYICTFLNSKIFSKIIMPSVNFGGGKGIDFLGHILLPKLEELAEDNTDVIRELYRAYQLTDEEIRFIEFQ